VKTLIEDLGMLGILLSLCVLVVRYVQERWHKRSHAEALANCKSFFNDNVWAPLMAFLCLFIVLGLSIGPYKRDHDQQTEIASLNQRLTESKGNAERLQTLVERKTHTPDFRDPAFFNMIRGIQAFMAYRRAIGPDAHCKILFTEPPPGDMGPNIRPLSMALMQIAVAGSNCPNGNLQNIGVKVDDADAESLNGIVPNVIVLHAPSDAKGANELEVNLGNIIQIRRSYKLPKLTAASENVIWLQLGPGLKWNDELH